MTMEYGTITGRLVAAVADTIDDIDGNPDIVPISGTVTFTPSVSAVVVASDGLTVVPSPIVAQLDGQGYVALNGQQGVTVLATDSRFYNPNGWTYRVSFDQLAANGRRVTFNPYSIKVPAGTTVDLSSVTPIPSSTGEAIVRGPKGDKGDPGIQGPAGPGGSDSDVATYVASPTSLTGSAADLRNDKRYGRNEQGALGILYAGLANRNAAACNIVFAGSSTTDGTAASTQAKSYVNLLSGFIQSAYPASGTEAPVVKSGSGDFGTISTTPGVHAYNVGVGGTAADTYLPDSVVQKVAAISPVAIFHMVGSNDFSLNRNPATYKSDIAGRISMFDSLLAKPCVHVLIQPYERYDSNVHTYPWSAYGDALRQLSNERPGNVVFLDISKFYYPIGIPGADFFGLMATDKVHQLDLGHAFMSDTLARQLALTPRALASGAKPLAQLATDTFSRADSQLIGSTTETGARTWAGVVAQAGATVGAADVLVQSGAVGAKPAGIGSNSFVFIDSGASNHLIEATLTALGTGVANQGGGFAVRVGTDGSGIWLSTRVNSSTLGWALYEASTTATTLLAQYTTTAPAVNDRVKVIANGGTVTAFVNNVQILQASTARVGTGGGFSISPAGTASRYDNFVISS